MFWIWNREEIARRYGPCWTEGGAGCPLLRLRDRVLQQPWLCDGGRILGLWTKAWDFLHPSQCRWWLGSRGEGRTQRDRVQGPDLCSSHTHDSLPLFITRACFLNPIHNIKLWSFQSLLKVQLSTQSPLKAPFWITRGSHAGLPVFSLPGLPGDFANYSNAYVYHIREEGRVRVSSCLCHWTAVILTSHKATSFLICETTGWIRH